MLVKIGKIVNSHGVSGDVRVLSNSDFKDMRFKVGNELTVKLKKEQVVVKITKSYPHKNFQVLHFEGYNNINDIMKFKNCDVYDVEIKSEDLDEGEYLNNDLVGLKVTDQDKQDLGVTLEVIDNPAHNLLRIKHPNKKTYLIPFNDVYITDVDLDNKLIEINNVKGLIDED